MFAFLTLLPSRYSYWKLKTDCHLSPLQQMERYYTDMLIMCFNAMRSARCDIWNPCVTGNCCTCLYFKQRWLAIQSFFFFFLAISSIIIFSWVFESFEIIFLRFYICKLKAQLQLCFLLFFSRNFQLCVSSFWLLHKIISIKLLNL